MPIKIGSLCVATLLGVTALSAVPAWADESNAPISVKVNMARILRISAPAATVVVGNPGVADVTIQDARTLVLTGKSYGETNMIVLDAKGNPIADTLVQVVEPQADLVTMFTSGGARSTFHCAPVCQQTVMLGDNPAYTGQVTASMGMVQGIAQ